VSEGGGARRPPWPEFRAALDAAGFRPSRRFGQNFLLDGNMARAIARDAGVGPGERVIEVGTGCGFLTAALLEQGVDLAAIEIDERLAGVARGLLGDGFRLVVGDALAGKHALSAELEGILPGEGDWHLVANLPYSISAPLMVLLAGRDAPPRSMTALVQREVAERIVAEPGGEHWGALGIRLGWTHDARITRIVPADLFWPRPKVESAVVRLELAAERPGRQERAALDRLVEALFRQRRKALPAALSPLCRPAGRARELLEGLGIDPARRGETLSPAELRALSEALEGAPGA
jgi:16S rRNA (adenine1518-N6/adenine1519-N6)-dimethyltransferase